MAPGIYGIQKEECKMRVDIVKQPGLTEDYAKLYCAKETAEIAMIANFIKMGIKQLLGKSDGVEKELFLNDIFYFESVDKKTFAYLEESVWEVDISLKEIEEDFAGRGFVRINKSAVVNLYKIELTKKDFEMRMLILLENGETLIINRHYKKNFQNSLIRMKEALSGRSL